MNLRLPWTGLSPQARRGLLTHALQWQAVQVGSLFVGVYLFKLGHGYGLPAWHAFCTYLAVPPGYWLAAGLTRRYGAGVSLRLGLLVYACFQALILALGASAGRFAGSLGLVWGLGMGIYWQAWVLLMVDLSSEGADRDAMLGGSQAVSFVASFTLAPLAGWFLTRFEGTGGYPWLFGTGLALFAAAWVVSLPLKGKPQHGGSALRRLVQVRKPQGWNSGLLSSLLLGVTSVGTAFLPMLLSYEAGGNEGYSGGYAAFTALAGFAASVWVARKGSPEGRSPLIGWSALAVAAFTLPLAFDRSYALVLLYGFGMSMCLSVFNVPLFAAHIRIVESSPRFRHRRADAMLLREVPLGVGRCLACGGLILFVEGLRSSGLTVLLVILALVPFANFLLMRPYLGPSTAVQPSGGA